MKPVGWMYHCSDNADQEFARLSLEQDTQPLDLDVPPQELYTKAQVETEITALRAELATEKAARIQAETKLRDACLRDPVVRLNNICDGLAEDADKSPFSQEAWDELVASEQAMREQLAAANQIAWLAVAKAVRDAMSGIGNLCDAQQDTVLEGADILRMLGQLSPAADIAELEGLVRDAERYRYIQGIAYIGVTRHNECLWSLRGLYEKEGQTLDATIDAAMKGAEP